MARRTPLTSLNRIHEINLTPLMDLTFILLITFIITFPLIEQGLPINLPKAKADDLSSVEASTVTVDQQGIIHLNDVPVTAEALRDNLVALVESQPDVTVMVRADERLPYGEVVRVLKILHAASVKKLALVTQEDKE